MSGNYRRNGRRGGMAQRNRKALLIRLLTADEMPTPVQWQYEPQLYPVGWRTTSSLYGQPASVEIIATKCELPSGARDPKKPLPRSYHIIVTCGRLEMKRWITQGEFMAKFPPPLAVTTPAIEEPPFGEEDTKPDIKAIPPTEPEEDQDVETFEVKEGA